MNNVRRFKPKTVKYADILKSKTRVSLNQTCFHRALIKTLFGGRDQQEGLTEFTDFFSLQTELKE